MSKLDFGKYKGVIISIALFILLDASVLILNFYISFQISSDALSVNLSGRQRMLSQRMMKALAESEFALIDNPSDFKSARDEIELTRNLFDETLNAFYEGGTVTGADGSRVELKQATSPISVKAMDQAFKLWTPYKTAIDKVLIQSSTGIPLGDSQFKEDLDTAVALGQAYNLKLLGLMNTLTVDLQNVATGKANTLRLIQAIGITLAVINFFIILFHFLGQLRNTDRKLEAARSETTNILSTVNEGLFLINSDLFIGQQYSEELCDIFERKDIAGLHLEELLDDLVSTKEMDTAKSFIKLLFEKKIKEKLIQDLNPLHEVEVFFKNVSTGNSSSKFLQFDFSKVTTDDEKLVLVTVRDITKETLLARELEAEKSKSEDQLQVLSSIIHAHPTTLRQFIQSAYATFDRINSQLMQPEVTQRAYLKKIDAIFNEVHRFKGESGALDLHHFVSLSHTFEDELAELKEKPSLVGQDFISLTVKLEELIQYTQTIEDLSEKMHRVASDRTMNIEAQSEVAQAAAASAQTSSMSEWNHLDKFSKELANRQRKFVTLVRTGLSEVQLPQETKELVNNICIQFLRNAITHGIETPFVRKLSKKPEQARVDIRLCRVSENRIELTILDNGRGINAEQIKSKAVEDGIATAEEVKSWGKYEILDMISRPGFSTAKVVTEDAGRGVGMNLIREQIRDAGGKIFFSTKPGRFCCFIISLPIETGRTSPASDATTTPDDDKSIAIDDPRTVVVA